MENLHGLAVELKSCLTQDLAALGALEDAESQLERALLRMDARAIETAVAFVQAQQEEIEKRRELRDALVTRLTGRTRECTRTDVVTAVPHELAPELDLLLRQTGLCLQRAMTKRNRNQQHIRNGVALLQKATGAPSPRAALTYNERGRLAHMGRSL